MDFPPQIRLSFEFGGRRFIDVDPIEAKAAGVSDDTLLDAFKADLKAQIDARAEAIRSSIATPGAGQAMEYQEAQSQATAALKATSTATAEKYPMLAVTIGIDIDPKTGQPATDVLGVARSVDAAREAWLTAGAAIRGTRLAAKKQIDEASSVEDAEAVVMGIAWPSLSA